MKYLINQYESLKLDVLSGIDISSSVPIKWYSQKLMAKQIHGHVPPSSNILEVGCGGSLTLHFLSRLKHNVIGLDKSVACVDYSNFLRKNMNTDVLIVNGDAFEIPFEDNYFDYVYSVGMIEHYEVGDQRKIVSEMVRVSRDFVHVEIPNPHPLSLFYIVSQDSCECHYSCNPGILLKDRGCKLIEVDGRCIFDRRCMLEKNPPLFDFISSHAPHLIKDRFSGKHIEDLCKFEMSASISERLVFGFQICWVAKTDLSLLR